MTRARARVTLHNSNNVTISHNSNNVTISHNSNNVTISHATSAPHLHARVRGSGVHLAIMHLTKTVTNEKSATRKNAYKMHQKHET